MDTQKQSSLIKLAHASFVALVFIISGCTTTANSPKVSDVNVDNAVKTSAKQNVDVETARTEANTPSKPEKRAAEIYPGTGTFTARPSADISSSSTEGDITLMFQDAPIEEVAMTILGDLLGRAYVVDERVKGSVSLKTGRPLARDSLIPVMENILKANNAVLAENDGVFQILPASEGLSSVVTPSYELDRQKGYQVIVVPLRYISATEMTNVLRSLQGENAMIQSDESRNILLVSGTQAELKNMLDTVEIFDVDQFKGMSTAIFRLSSSSASKVIQELNSIFGLNGEEGQAGVLRFVEIERLNAILAITPQRKYLNTVSQWVDRLDRVDNSIARTLHVYFVQNLRAGYLAQILSELFDADISTQEDGNQASLAPGLAGSTSSSSGIGNSDYISGEADGISAGVPTGAGASLPGSLSPNADRFASTDQASNGASNSGNNSVIKIIADEENNALVVKATKEEYQDIADAIKRLDISPLQVLLEATIVEVELTGDLQYGTQWLFRNNDIDSNTGIGRLGLGVGGADATLAGIASEGFSYSLVDSGGLVRGVLSALARDNKMQILSSPSLMVLDNHTASINVGDQVPVRTSESTNTGTSDLVTSTIQFVETGVTLQVAPRVSQSGNVVMDIYQSIRTANETETSGIDSPTIGQREVSTSVSVPSGDTIVLGGLIQDTNGQGNVGVPGLRNLPILGSLFGTTTNASSRTELLVLITPTAIRDAAEAREATNELRKKLDGLDIPELNNPEAKIKAIERGGVRW
ncbi:MAG: type II secretion system protein GspD [Gammaproteobacteria bacterium]|nr:MAG: type II secretion system protein GspD [Gammaproteobacteria bacterium]